jgi:hypothetical protein
MLIFGWSGCHLQCQAKNQIIKKPADLVRSAGKLEVKTTFKENLANDATDSRQQRFHHEQNLRNFLSIEQR